MRVATAAVVLVALQAQGPGDAARRAAAAKALSQLDGDGNLLPLWTSDTYFPLVYSKSRIEREAAHRLSLMPK